MAPRLVEIRSTLGLVQLDDCESEPTEFESSFTRCVTVIRQLDIRRLQYFVVIT